MRILAFFVLFLLPVVAVAKENSPFPRFNPCTLTEIKGTVLSVQKINLINTPYSPNTQLIVRYKNADMTVELGPEWFLNANGVFISSSDKVEIKGSLVKIKGHYIVIASDLKINNLDLKLRDNQGNPLWQSAEKR